MGSDDQSVPGIRVTVTDGRGRPVRAAGLDRWLSRVAPARTRGLITVALVTDARVRALNRRYRGRDCATDVLSFPAEKRGRTPFSGAPKKGYGPFSHPFSHLGDIVIARGVARRQAREAGHAEREEHRILALHGLLHLLGYDHERDRGQMARLERKLRKKGGLPEGLTERGGRRPRATSA